VLNRLPHTDKKFRMSTSATPTIAFNGLSSYSSDFQAILNRQVQIQQLPVQQLQNQQTDLLQKQSALTALDPVVASLGASLAALSALGSGQGLEANSSDSSVVSVVNSGATSAASYSISNITSLAQPASETSLSGYTDATTANVSSAGQVNLVYGANTYTINLTSQTNNLSGLAAAINKLDVGVNATILSTGTGATPDYLTLSAASPGQTTLQLQDVPVSGAPVNLISATNQGTNSQFDLNGLPVTKSSNTINNVVPGVTFTIVNTTAPSQSVLLTLSPNASSLSTALQNFAQSYNSLADQVNGQIGAGAGPLAGDSLVYTLSSDLQQVSSYYGGSGSIRSLADLGLTFDSTGQISFDPSVVNSLSASQVQDAFGFLGSSTSGFGSLANVFNQISDSTTGVIQQEQTSYTAENSNLTDKINTLNTQISQFQTNLTSQLSAADATVTELQNQLVSVNASIQSLDLVLYGRQTNTNGL